MHTTKFIGIEPPNFTVKFQNKRFEFCYILDEKTDCGEFEWYILHFECPDYGKLVDEIIHLYYSDADMTAVINNYLLEGESEGYLQMQNIRKKAKEKAKFFIEELNKLENEQN